MVDEVLGNQKTVEVLWKRLYAMEAERRFDGSEYPSGTARFPFKLSGQGFFPGGDGLWREEENLNQPSAGILPSRGIVFVGNDFGSLKSFQRLTKGFENPLTWRHIKARIRAAELPTYATFFTNAFVGLRENQSALEPKDWEEMPEFCRFCGEFLAFQLEQLSPKLVVLMGPKAQGAFDALARNSSVLASFKILRTGHPYADFNLSSERRAEDIKLLAEAWRTAI